MLKILRLLRGQILLVKKYFRGHLNKNLNFEF